MNNGFQSFLLVLFAAATAFAAALSAPAADGAARPNIVLIMTDDKY